MVQSCKLVALLDLTVVTMIVYVQANPGASGGCPFMSNGQEIPVGHPSLPAAFLPAGNWKNA